MLKNNILVNLKQIINQDFLNLIMINNNPNFNNYHLCNNKIIL